MKRFKASFIMFGIILFSSFILLQKDDFPDLEEKLIQEASEVNEENIWPNFDMQIFPIEIREDDNAYLFYKDEKIKREPALPVLAATVYKVDGEIQVFMPSKDAMEDLGRLMEDSNQGGFLFSNAFSLSGMKLTDNHYIALLYHEIFHGYQMKYYENDIFGNMPSDFNERDTYQYIESIKDDNTLYELYLNQNRVLYDIIKGEKTINDYKNAREAYIHALNQRYDQKIVEDIVYLENYYEKIEGTARYVQLKVLFALDEKQLYNQYIENISEDVDGKEKYLRSGMAIALLLDTYRPDWKSDVFSSDLSLYDYLINID